MRQQQDIPLAVTTAQQMRAAGMSLTDASEMIRKAIVRVTLEEVHGNLCHAARALGTHRNTISRVLREFKLEGLAAHMRDGAKQQRTLKLPKPSRAA